MSIPCQFRAAQGGAPGPKGCWKTKRTFCWKADLPLDYARPRGGWSSNLTMLQGGPKRRWGTIPVRAALSLNEGYLMSTNTPNLEANAGEQVPPRPHDAGSGANETMDGLDATTEALRHAAEDTPSDAPPDDVEIVAVFDRADLTPKI